MQMESLLRNKGPLRKATNYAKFKLTGMPICVNDFEYFELDFCLLFCKYTYNFPAIINKACSTACGIFGDTF